MSAESEVQGHSDPDPSVASRPIDLSDDPSDDWDFAGWGKAEHIGDLHASGGPIKRLDQAHKGHLGVWASTAICGNDITSSVLYVSALCATQAGVYAPVSLALVCAVLFLFRSVYAEVGSALPLNGGTYTVLLNTTNKKLAAGAAVLTILSYVATAVISAGEAMHYAHNLWHGLPIFWATVALLGLFAFLNVVGVSESAVVAIGIFVIHMVTLAILALACGIAILGDPSTLMANWHLPSPEGGLARALFFGFAAAMLGISGFESSANFIEEQKPGVFPKTLRNMWLAVSVFNPLISLLSLGMLPLAAIQETPPDLLAEMGSLSAGQWLRMLVSIDAVLVLSGAVLTSYVGVTGLVRRMALDRCLPDFLLVENSARKTNHWIILGFFAICCSILTSTNGDVEVLAGVYTISFLAVMALFAVGNMLLKVSRKRLPRTERASWPAVTIALLAVLFGLAGNVFMNPAYLTVFGLYFGVFGGVVALMFLRVPLLKVGLFIFRAFVSRVLMLNQWADRVIRSKIDEINGRVIIYFTKGDDPAELNRAAMYVLENEQTSHLKVVHVHEAGTSIPSKLAENLTQIDKLYPHLRIDFVSVNGAFTPELIDQLSTRLSVPKNYMFIGTPGDRFPHRIADLGGVRVIL